MPADLKQIYDELAAVVRQHAKGFELLDHLENSTAREKKQTLLLRGKKLVSVDGRPPKKIYIGGIMFHKSYVGFYLMPLYSRPGKFKLSPALAKTRKGKSCFHIKKLDTPIKAELDDLLKRSVKCFKDLGWV